MMDAQTRHVIRRDMEEASYRSEHRPGRRWLVRIPGPEMNDRFGDESLTETTDAYGWGDTEEEAFLNAQQQFDRKAKQIAAEPHPVQGRLELHAHRRTDPCAA